jgi:CRP-like cAMP-binding protein
MSGKAFSLKPLPTGPLGNRRAVAYRKKSAIFQQGDPADSVFFVSSGLVKIAVASPGGRDAIVAMIVAGGFFGEASLAGQSVRTTTATTMTDCTLIAVERSAFAQLLTTEPGFSDVFLAHMLTRAIRSEEDLIDHLFNPSEKRLARALLLLANADREEGPVPIAANVSQETLAEMIGTTRSRVSFFMNKFRRHGFIRYGKGLEIYPALLMTVL